MEDSNTSCIADLYDNVDFYIAAGVRTTVAIFSLVCSVVVISLICCCRKYEFSNQRLILCLAAISALHSVVFAVGRPTRNVLDISCWVLGFADLYSSWVELLFIGCITMHLLLLVIYGREPTYTIYIFISFATPLLWCLLPFINLSYGSSGPWCGIRIHRSDEDCSLYSLGAIFRFAFWQVPLYTIFLIFFIVCLLLVFKKLRRDSVKWEGAHYDPEAKKAKNEVISQVKPLLFYPMVFLILKLPLLLNQIYEAVRPQEPELALWLLDALVTPLGGAVTALLYVCDATTLSKIRRCCQHCLCCYLSLSIDRAEEGFSRTRSIGSQVENYCVGLETTFGDSMEGQRAKVARQKRKIEERLAAGLRNASTDCCVEGNNDDPQASVDCSVQVNDAPHSSSPVPHESCHNADLAI